MEMARHEKEFEPKIFGLRIRIHGVGAYALAFRHTGEFRIDDFDELDFEVRSSRLIKSDLR